MLGDNAKFPFLGTPINHHAMSHYPEAFVFTRKFVITCNCWKHLKYFSVRLRASCNSWLQLQTLSHFAWTRASNNIYRLLTELGSEHFLTSFEFYYNRFKNHGSLYEKKCS